MKNLLSHSAVEIKTENWNCPMISGEHTVGNVITSVLELNNHYWQNRIYSKCSGDGDTCIWYALTCKPLGPECRFQQLKFSYNPQSKEIDPISFQCSETGHE